MAFCFIFFISCVYERELVYQIHEGLILYNSTLFWFLFSIPLLQRTNVWILGACLGLTALTAILLMQKKIISEWIKLVLYYWNSIVILAIGAYQLLNTFHVFSIQKGSLWVHANLFEIFIIGGFSMFIGIHIFPLIASSEDDSNGRNTTLDLMLYNFCDEQLDQKRIFIGLGILVLLLGLNYVFNVVSKGAIIGLAVMFNTVFFPPPEEGRRGLKLRKDFF